MPALAGAPSVAGGQSLPEAEVATGHEYRLEARLDPEAHAIDGRATITWRNDSVSPANEVYLHLYLNAFASEDSVFMTESGGQLRGDRFRGYGAITVESLTRAGRDLLARADDELVEGDHTQMRVPLRAPVAPGESARFEVEFRSELPPVFARSGWHEEFHMVAQWFPKIARRERDGTWRSFPYHAHGEFYADFGRYELRVDVPEGWEVGATGRMTGEQIEGGRVVRTFEATRVHDCAFAAAPWFRETRSRFERTNGTEVAVRFLHPPGFESSVERHVEVTLAGLRHFGARFGQYPYETLTVIVPPRGASGAAGMEYPTLFVTAGPWLRIPGMPMVLHDEVSAHELGHQWFQGMLASDEVRHPMLDEGLTEWATGDLLRELHGPQASGVALGSLRAGGFAIRRRWAFANPRSLPPATAASDFRPGDGYGASIYGRTSVTLEMIARVWGRQRLESALGTYARRHRFDHPTPADLYRAFEDEYGSWMPERILRPALEEGAYAALAVEPLRFDEETRQTWVQAERGGGLPVPTHVLVESEDGERKRLAWPGDEVRFERTLEGRWISALVDPDAHVLLDPEPLDNAHRLEDAPPAGASSLFAQALYWVQLLIAGGGP